MLNSKIELRNSLEKMQELWDNNQHELKNLLSKKGFDCILEVHFGWDMVISFENKDRDVRFSFHFDFDRNTVVLRLDEQYHRGIFEVIQFSELDSWSVESFVGKLDLNVTQIVLDYFLSFFKKHQLDFTVRIINNTSKEFSFDQHFEIKESYFVPTGEVSTGLLELVSKMNVKHYADNQFYYNENVFENGEILISLNHHSSSLDVYHEANNDVEKLFVLKNIDDIESFNLWISSVKKQMEDILKSAYEILSKKESGYAISFPYLMKNDRKISKVGYSLSNDGFSFRVQTPNLSNRYHTIKEATDALVYGVDVYEEFLNLNEDLKEKINKYGEIEERISLDESDYRIKSFDKFFQINITYILDFHLTKERIRIGNHICKKEKVEKTKEFKVRVNDLYFSTPNKNEIISLVYDEIFSHVKKSRMRTLFTSKDE